LLFHLPLRYQDRTRVRPIAELGPGDHGMIEAEVRHGEVVGRRRRMLVVGVADASGTCRLRFFHFTTSQYQRFRQGQRLRCFGEMRAGPQGLEMVHPEYRLLDGDESAPPEASALTAIYPSTEGVRQGTLRRLCAAALARLDELVDWLPPRLLREVGLPPLAEALAYVHRPPPSADTALLESGHHPAQRRLAFEELLAHHLSLRQLRARNGRQGAPPVSSNGALAGRLERALPFRLTAGQARALEEIVADLGQPHPMARLLQGDVGSGKTVTAALAALHVIDSGYQAAVMAPTEILAEQHYRNLQTWYEPLGCTVVWLTGRQRAATRRVALEQVASGGAQMIVGTHALVQDEVVFDDLALVIIDEQHRFGVHQRLALREKGQAAGRYPHQLIMTATPIPRTLAMTAYADLDVSVIAERPPGRKPVKTVAVADTRREVVIERIRHACALGRQAYWVCTLIDESELLQAQAAEDTARLLAQAMPELRVELIHGRLKSAQREAVMAAFQTGALDLLVATTVIEVGVDVPNASLMIVENAERLGLAQLHQLRGRVGRGERESTCVLLYHPPLSPSARRRLGVMRETDDGFRIAEVDLRLRGAGEVLGTRQTGAIQFRIADLGRDADLLTAVRRAADRLLAEYPERAARLMVRWLGDSTRYGDA
jgi:ATP-dependent DNA helicase RecG